MTCDLCGRDAPADRETGYDADTRCPECRRSTDALEVWAEHTRECLACRPHLGHVPFGLCPEGLKLFLEIDT